MGLGTAVWGICPGYSTASTLCPRAEQAAVLSLVWMLLQSDRSENSELSPHNRRALPQDLAGAKNLKGRCF